MKKLLMSVLLFTAASSAYAGKAPCTESGVPRSTCFCIDGKCADLSDPGVHP
ncbi:TPA: hypothetical protein ACXNDR_004295 [Serratia marcescens]